MSRKSQKSGTMPSILGMLVGLLLSSAEKFQTFHAELQFKQALHDAERVKTTVPMQLNLE